MFNSISWIIVSWGRTTVVWTNEERRWERSITVLGVEPCSIVLCSSTSLHRGQTHTQLHFIHCKSLHLRHRTSLFVSYRPTGDGDVDKWKWTRWLNDDGDAACRPRTSERVWRPTEWQTDHGNGGVCGAAKRRPTEIIGVTIHATIRRARHHRWCGRRRRIRCCRRST